MNDDAESVYSEASLDAPVNLKLRLEKCPKCGYERCPGDDDYASVFECPKCGVVYALAMEEVRQRNKGQQRQDEAEVHALRANTSSQNTNLQTSRLTGVMFVRKVRSRGWIYFVLGIGALALIVFVFY